MYTAWIAAWAGSHKEIQRRHPDQYTNGVPFDTRNMAAIIGKSATRVILNIARSMGSCLMYIIAAVAAEEKCLFSASDMATSKSGATVPMEARVALMNKFWRKSA